MKKVFYLYIFFYFLLLSYLALTLSISPKEALIFYKEKSLLHYIVNLSTTLFGKNGFGLKVFFISLNIINIFLLFNLSLKKLKKAEDALLAAIIFSLLPGFISSSLVVTKVSIIIFFTLLFLNLPKKSAIFLFPIMLLIDRSFAIFFLGIFFYSVYKKDRFMMILSLIFFTLSMYIFGFDVKGKPKNFFLDTFGVYSAIFSPLVFIYFFYVLYRVLVKGKKEIVWFISFVSFIFSLLLSFRQRISFEDFAPFVLIGVIIMVKEFLSSYRVRLPEFRKRYKTIFLIVIGSLILNDMVLIFNKNLYFILKDPKKHFAYNFHISKELASRLKKDRIFCVKTDNKALQYQLKFYDIKRCNDYILTDFRVDETSKKVSIFYKNILLKNYYVSKINNK